MYFKLLANLISCDIIKIHKLYEIISNNKQTIKRIWGETSYSKYAVISTISLLKGEETNIIKSKKLKAMEPFLSIKPQALKKQC